MSAAFIALACVCIGPSLAQTAQQPKVTDTFKYFIGSWEGTSKGQMGVGSSHREYRDFMGGAYIEARNQTIHAPQEKSPKGGRHEDYGVISYDRMKKKFMLRQFHVEGFVNEYVLISISPDGKEMIWETESIENMPAGWRARETHKIVSNDEFVEIFELAPPGKSFFTYSETVFKRKR